MNTETIWKTDSDTQLDLIIVGSPLRDKNIFTFGNNPSASSKNWVLTTGITVQWNADTKKWQNFMGGAGIRKQEQTYWSYFSWGWPDARDFEPVALPAPMLLMEGKANADLTHPPLATPIMMFYVFAAAPDIEPSNWQWILYVSNVGQPPITVPSKP